MSLKNYYAVLGVPQSASSDEIRTAYRALAKKYHPDAAPDNPYADAHFAEISVAYEILSNPSSRTAYDEERWLRGLSTRSKAAIRITPEWIKGESTRLRNHMASIDTYRMSHTALKDYVVALLSDEHMSILQGAPQITRGAILEDLLVSMAHLHYSYAEQVSTRLKLLAGDDEASNRSIKEWAVKRSHEARWNKYQPIIVLIATALLCVLLWWLSRRH